MRVHHWRRRLAAWEETVRCAALLHATAILFQCPASFKSTDENIAAMRAFIGAIERPAGVNLMWEPRGPWPDDVVSELSRDLHLIHAVDPFVRSSRTPELLYWRLHGNESHWARYSDDELRQVVDWLPEDSSVYAYVLFNNIPRVKDIRRLRELYPDLFTQAFE